MMQRTVKSNGAGIYEVSENGEHIGMIMGSEHYTGERRRHWIINLYGEPTNHTMTLKEAKQYAGVK